MCLSRGHSNHLSFHFFLYLSLNQSLNQTWSCTQDTFAAEKKNTEEWRERRVCTGQYDRFLCAFGHLHLIERHWILPCSWLRNSDKNTPGLTWMGERSEVVVQSLVQKSKWSQRQSFLVGNMNGFHGKAVPQTHPDQMCTDVWMTSCWLWQKEDCVLNLWTHRANII